jgi:hypothetical protein
MMKNKAVFLMLVFGSLLFSMGSCSNGNERSSNNGVKMDSASIATRAADELTLSTLKDKKLAAEQEAEEAISNTKEAKRIERDATDAADQADQAFKTEEAAQKSRQQADDQAAKSNKASTKSDKN